MTERAFRILEVREALEYVAGYAVTDRGRQAVLALRPRSDPAWVDAELNAVVEVVDLFDARGSWPLPSFADVSEWTARLARDGSVRTQTMRVYNAEEFGVIEEAIS